MIVSIEGAQVARFSLVVPARGAWSCEAVLVDAPELAGRVTVRVGSTELVGTVVETGTRGLQRTVRVLGGAGAWGQSIGPKAYHNDAGVKARLLAEDAARAVGETLDWSLGDGRVGTHFARREGAASRTLERASSGAWWVGYDGVTRVGERESVDVAEGVLDVVDYDAARRVLVVHCDDLSAIPVGATVREGVDEPLTIRELELEIGEDSALFRLYVGAPLRRSALVDPIARIVDAILAERLLGHYRYRVVRMATDRVELQLVERRRGLPDILPISQWPGVAGVHADLADGAHVLVAFVDGDPAQPAVVAYAGRDGIGWEPTSLNVCGGTRGAARVDDEVEVTIPVGTVVVAATGATLNAEPIIVTGKINEGSAKVVIG